MGSASDGDDDRAEDRQLIRLTMWAAALVVFWTGFFVHIIR